MNAAKVFSHMHAQANIPAATTFPLHSLKVKEAKSFSAYVHRQTLRQQGSLPYTHSCKNEGNKELSKHTRERAKMRTSNN